MTTQDDSASPLDIPVSGEIFALIDPAGKIRTAGTTLDSVTRTLIEKDMPKTMWNAIFGNSDPEARAKIYEQYGWRVLQGTLTPNVMSPAKPAM